MSESVLMMLRFGGYALIILLVVFVIAVLTPKLAAFIDKIAAKGKNPERVEGDLAGILIERARALAKKKSEA